MDIKELNEQLNGLLEQNNTITIEFLGGYATTEKTYYDNGSTGNIVNGWDNKQYETITVDPQNFMSRLADVAGSYLYCGFVTSSDLSLQINEIEAKNNFNVQYIDIKALRNYSYMHH